MTDFILFMLLLMAHVHSRKMLLRLAMLYTIFIGLNEPPHDKTNKMACAPSEDSDQPGHPPSLIRVFTVRLKKAWVLSYPMSAQADLNLRWAHSHCVVFFMRRLKFTLFLWITKTSTCATNNLIK